MSYKIDSRTINFILDAFGNFDQEKIIKIIKNNPEILNWNKNYILNRYISDFNYLNFYNFFLSIIGLEFSSEIQKKIVDKIIQISDQSEKERILILLFVNGFYPYYFYDLSYESSINVNSVDDYLIHVFELIDREYSIDYERYYFNAKKWASFELKQRILVKML